MGLVSDMLKNQRSAAWREAGNDKGKRRECRKAAYGNPNRPSKRLK
jgi:hypothetical protein